MADDEEQMNRRRFFREGMRGIFEKIGKAAGPLQRVMKELEAAQGASGFTDPSPAARHSRPSPATPAPTPSPSNLRYLRPPGAKPDDQDFITTCSACGNCASVCPVQCITIDPARAGGAPFIIASDTACTLCDGLLCMYSCPTGAITPIPIGLIRMGTAQWNEERCVRSQGTECTMCIDRCPIGNRAIELLEGKVVVHEGGCTGCGVCEHDCPTSPKSIIVIPADRRT